ncbi:MAG: S1 family peptidase [Gordonia sp. (in: high G+C Gram-positive bacteria)]
MRRLLRIVTVIVGLVLALIPAVHTAQAAPRATVGGGSGIVIDNRYGCTMTTVGTDRAGRLIGLTAGHCGKVGSRIASQRTPAAGVIGRIVVKSKPGDYAVIALDRRRVTPTRVAGGATIRGIGTFPRAGATVCKSGITTGYSCGQVLDIEGSDTLSYVCANHGDSGGPVLSGNRLVGMLNGGLVVRVAGVGGAVGCVHPAIPVYTPMVATKMTAIVADLNRVGGAGAGFRTV